MDDTIKKTPLYDVHTALGAKIVDYYSFKMPLQYDSIISEHKSVRNDAGLFDISHMGEIVIDGKGATELVQKIITNDVSNLPDYKAVYSPICDEEGGTIDDILVYKYNPEKYMLVVNCSTTNRDFKWINKHKTEDTNINNVSDQISLLAIQGPKSEEIMRLVFGEKCASLSRFQFTEITENEMKPTVSRTGYTGEDGFEIFVDNSHCVELWNILLKKGKEMGLKPAGLGARDTLRLEAGYLLFGNEIDDFTTPMEAGIGWTVKFDKPDFIGKDALIRSKRNGSKRALIAFKMLDKGIPRTGSEIVYRDNVIGKVTSGTFSPTLGIGIGLGYVLKHIAEHKSPISIRIRDTDFSAKIVNTPFITKNGKK
ncbi:MAG: glycine cleavage system aminomethyltransferase GcvT [Candidatus Scalindua rubra]|uniref:Aminomethyltransferase n=1 Tax=Candidatus Scalindua brodae TaxID=237368 RepID=A0A0B0EKJ4_9BACT|nr:MAG: T-protein of glycine cleavage system [Candidatus Scalindua brodae]MBZ0110808.1 glycine cleavage system aminomethyltransferase GcvT [Candidatus Scalindua rubra]